MSDTSETIEFLRTRRSWPPRMLAEPAPEGAALDAIIEAGLRVPDHGKMEPWRLIVLDRAALDRLRQPLRQLADSAGLSEKATDKELSSLDSPLIIAVVFQPQASEKIPEWEQFLSAGSVCLSLLNAALASGWGAAWLSGPMVTDAEFGRSHLGLDATERLVGLVHVGSRGDRSAPPERPRPDIAAKVQRL